MVVPRPTFQNFSISQVTNSNKAVVTAISSVSTVRIDQDGCTFWYTTEFYKVTQTFDWSTQIASAKFSNCK